MLPASADRKAGYPDGWEEFAKKLSGLQRLPSALVEPSLKRERPRDIN